MRAIGLRLAAGLVLAGLALAGAMLVAASQEANAHSRVFFGFGFGYPYHYPYYYKRYRAPRYYYHPPPAVYVPPPRVYYVPPPRVVVRTCRDYRGDATIDATGARFYGRACLMSDGRWHIVERY